ncbi:MULTISPECIES: GntR family transcriptional regulator [Lacticaseibacillus]|uniref:GntR family transcriptional regulator n=1 Tax=Lacticaseibacillus huelsenbergensis TaxID=3035291 RepID=A0ABY8DY13_9LACO|nr:MULTISPECIES: GntR family transcriptional regulator [Lacticaseibacillus]MDG3061176.1 GntR family transcriptional regulator [Lacticaseibacillus sp. BCRC 81376]WFB40580.1 GntR family transcriptional regulator [Lacticaseibacillus huelsenbergensis]
MEKVPLTKQLVDQLETFIKEKLQPNDKLPSERDLSELYHVSRNTVRSALDELFLRGFIYRSTGKGTFVAERFDERTDVSGSYSFTKQMLAMNRQPVTKIQRLEKIAVPANIAKRMRIDPGTPVYVLDRLRIADKLPMMIERSYLPALTVPDLEKDALEKSPLYDWLEEHYGIHIASVDEAFFAGLVSPEDAKLLRVAPASACLNIRRTTFADTGEIVEYTLSVARADQFVYHVHHVNH